MEQLILTPYQQTKTVKFPGLELPEKEGLGQLTGYISAFELNNEEKEHEVQPYLNFH